jgi:hypothetical protein
MQLKWKTILTFLVIKGWFKLWLIYTIIKYTSSIGILYLVIAFRKYCKVNYDVFPCRRRYYQSYLAWAADVKGRKPIADHSVSWV